jgi:peptide/nickel transport system substrate-binding protein
LLSDVPSIKILPKAEVETSGADFNQVLIGTGPFKFVHQKINEIRLDAMNARIPHLVFKVIRDDFTRYQKMLKGEVDIAQNELPSEKIGEFEVRKDRFQVHKYPGLNMTYVLLNLRDSRLQNPSVRLALAEALNREEMIRYKLYGLAEPATSILTPNNPYFNSVLKNPSFNPNSAKERMTAAGLLGTDFVLKTSNTPGAIDGGRVLAHQMEQAGFKIRHESYEWGTYYDDIKKGNFQLATMKWVGTVDPDIYRAAFHSKELPPGRNRGAYKNEVVDRLLEKGSEEENFETRRKIFLEVQRLVHQDLAILPLWWDRQVAVHNVRVKHYQPVMTSDYWPFTVVSKEP